MIGIDSFGSWMSSESSGVSNSKVFLTSVGVIVRSIDNARTCPLAVPAVPPFARALACVVGTSADVATPHWPATFTGSVLATELAAVVVVAFELAFEVALEVALAAFVALVASAFAFALHGAVSLIVIAVAAYEAS